MLLFPRTRSPTPDDWEFRHTYADQRYLPEELEHREDLEKDDIIVVDLDSGEFEEVAHRGCFSVGERNRRRYVPDMLHLPGRKQSS